jgi:hypothetical protein
MEMKIQEIENKSPKKRQISYDDLLSNMGFKLNNGKLELYNKRIDYIEQNNKNNKINQENKIQEAQPMTKEQYKRLLRLQYIHRLKEKERINNIKSTKLLFSNPLTIQNINHSLSVPNKFFHFSR